MKHIVVIILFLFLSCNYSSEKIITVGKNSGRDVLAKFETKYSANILETKKAGNWIFAKYTKNDSTGLVAIHNDSLVFVNNKMVFDEFYYADLKSIVFRAKQKKSNKEISFKYIFQLNTSNIWQLSYIEKKECADNEDNYFYTDKFKQKYTINTFSSFDFGQDYLYKYVFAKKNSPEHISNQLKNMQPDNIASFKNIFTAEHAEELLQSYPISPQNVITMNNIGFYLEQMSISLPAIIILETVVEKCPDRAVAMLNLGDAMIKHNLKIKAKECYSLYVKLMKEKGKQNEIAPRALN